MSVFDPGGVLLEVVVKVCAEVHSILLEVHAMKRVVVKRYK